MLQPTHRPDLSPPRTQGAAPAGRMPACRRRLTPARFLFCLLIAGTLAAAVSPAAAQQPPQPAPLRVTVVTDKADYAPGEPVFITVQVDNLLDREQALQFTSSLQADYLIDGAWRWSARRAFLTVNTSVVLPPHGTHVFPVFEHLPSDHYLAPGRHEIVAEVVRYGRALAVITVGPGGPGPAQFMLSPSITPSPAPFGAPIKLALTVTNVSNATASFGHDGCPVHFTIDDVYTPRLACPEYWRVVTLEPGQSIEFNAADYGYLLLDQPAFFLPPGWHSISFEVPGVGTTAARLQVTGNGGSIAGHVIGADGRLMEGATVQAIAFNWTDSTGTPPASDHFIHQTTTGPDGSYRLENLPPDVYFVRAFGFNTGEVWYNGAASRDQATPITVTEGAAVEGIDFALNIVPPPPPPVLNTYVFGTVMDEPPPYTRRPSRPIPGALVVVFQVAAGSDSGWVPPGDSAAAMVPPVGGAAARALDESNPPDPPVRPPLPPEMIRPVHFGFTDSLGHYEIRVPPGRYRALATAPGHRYEWYQEAATWRDADDAFVNNDLLDMVSIPTSFSLADLPPEAPAAVVRGIVRGVSPDDRDSVWIYPGLPAGGTGGAGDDPPPAGVPIEGARVVARPLVEDPRLMRPAPILYAAVTGPGGEYEIKLPADLPVIVRAVADGWHEQFYDHAPLEWLATPVDVAPGAATGFVDFDLFQTPRPPDFGSITGVVRSVDPRVNLRDCGRCLPPPLPGALVRVRAAAAGMGFEMVTRTDDQGFFAFDRLPLGPEGDRLAYYVSAEARGHVPAYYPGAYRWEAAQPVTPTPPWIQTFASTLITLPLRVQVDQGPHFAVGLVYATGGWVDGGPPDVVTPPGGGGDGGEEGNAGGDGNDGSGDGGVDSGGAVLRGLGLRGADHGRGLPGLIAGIAGDSTDPGWTGWFWSLGGAFLYLVSADPTSNSIEPVAGGVAFGNGTLVLRDLPAGRYRAYADRPGFHTGWFQGTNPQDAAVISIGPGIDPVLIHIRLEPLDAPPVPGGGGETSDLAEARTVINLHNAPNPFKPQTTIIYRLMTPAEVSVQVFDVNGRLVRTLFDRVRQESGEQRVPWDGRHDSGLTAGSGIYFYRVSTPTQASTGKMVMVR